MEPEVKIYVGAGNRRELDPDQLRVPVPEYLEVVVDDFVGFLDRFRSNISRGGVFLATDKPLPKGTALAVMFRLEDEYTLIRGQGTVVWSRNENLSPSLPAGMGVRFDWVDKDSELLINKIVSNFIKEGGKPFKLEGSETAPRTGAMSVAKPVAVEQPKPAAPREPVAESPPAEPTAAEAAAAEALELEPRVDPPPMSREEIAAFLGETGMSSVKPAPSQQEVVEDVVATGINDGFDVAAEAPPEGLSAIEAQGDFAPGLDVPASSPSSRSPTADQALSALSGESQTEAPPAQPAAAAGLPAAPPTEEEATSADDFSMALGAELWELSDEATGAIDTETAAAVPPPAAPAAPVAAPVPEASPEPALQDDFSVHESLLDDSEFEDSSALDAALNEPGLMDDGLLDSAPIDPGPGYGETDSVASYFDPHARRPDDPGVGEEMPAFDIPDELDEPLPSRPSEPPVPIPDPVPQPARSPHMSTSPLRVATAQLETDRMRTEELLLREKLARDTGQHQARSPGDFGPEVTQQAPVPETEDVLSTGMLPRIEPTPVEEFVPSGFEPLPQENSPRSRSLFFIVTLLLIAVGVAVIFLGKRYVSNIAGDDGRELADTALVDTVGLDDDGVPTLLSLMQDGGEVAIEDRTTRTMPVLSRVENITIDTEGDNTIVQIWADGGITPTNTRHLRLADPPRELIRILGVEAPYGAGMVEVGSTHVGRLRTGFHVGKGINEIHIVADLSDSSMRLQKFIINGNRLDIVFGHGDLEL